MRIRPFQEGDRPEVLRLWTVCGLTVPWNDPDKDMDRKLAEDASLFFVCESERLAPEGSASNARASEARVSEVNISTEGDSAAGDTLSENETLRAPHKKNICGKCTMAKSVADKGQKQSSDSHNIVNTPSAPPLLLATCMAGYDGHRGWIYYLAVDPAHRGKGLGREMVRHAEQTLRQRGCPKVNLMVRESNEAVLRFYDNVGYGRDEVVVLSKRLTEET